MKLTRDSSCIIASKDKQGLDRVWLDHPVYGKETIGEFLQRHKIPVQNGMFVLWHGRPKGSKYTTLRAGSYLAESPKDARFFAARDRSLKPEDVEVVELKLTSDQIEPGHFTTLRMDYKI